jgi:hypothetical protein
MGGVNVRLTWSEALLGATIGVQRQLEALAKGRPDSHGFDGLDGWSKHVEGACGELAVAKVLDKYWGGTVNTFKDGGDIGAAIQVRTRTKDYYDLIVRDDDKPEDVFVLVVGKAPSFRVVGWIRGRDAKQPAWIQHHGNRPAAYFVPQAQLTAFDSSQSSPTPP